MPIRNGKPSLIMYLSWSEDRPAVKRTVLTIYTIGYGSRTKGALLNLLELHNVGIVVDVRRWPTSKLERFRREELSRWLLAEGIDYIWMGEELGGYRKGGYKAHVKSEGFRKGVQHVLTLAAKQRTCLLCLEVSPRGCHRRFVATYLNRECGVKVLHILSKKGCWITHPCPTSSNRTNNIKRIETDRTTPG